MNSVLLDAERLRLAEIVRNACALVALEHFEQAREDGLCMEGAWEAAIGALRTLDLAPIVQIAPVSE